MSANDLLRFDPNNEGHRDLFINSLFNHDIMQTIIRAYRMALELRLRLHDFEINIRDSEKRYENPKYQTNGSYPKNPNHLTDDEFSALQVLNKGLSDTLMDVAKTLFGQVVKKCGFYTEVRDPHYIILALHGRMLEIIYADYVLVDMGSNSISSRQ